MKAIPWIAASAGALGALILGLGYAVRGVWPMSVLIGALWWFWLLGNRRRWGWVGWIVPLLILLAAAGTSWLDLGLGWMLLVIVFFLMAWDLDHFLRRRSLVPEAARAQEIEIHHLRRLLLTVILSLASAGLALFLQVRLSFWMVFTLAVFALLGLGQAIGYIRRISD